MIRGTTPTLVLELPFDVELLAEVWVSLAQDDVVIINKELSECQKQGNTLTIHLTQEETLSLMCECITQIQVRCKTHDGNALASQIISVYTEKILKDGVI